MKKALTATVIGALALGAAVPAFGQEGKPLGFDLRLGLFTPTDQNVKDLSDSWIAFGADYQLWHMKSSSISVSFDYAGKASYRNVPIILNYMVHSNQFYAFAGGGIGFLRDNDENLTSFAYQGGVGYNFGTTPESVFLEAKYIGSSVQAVNGVGVYIGVRF